MAAAPIETAADYADALLIARKAKGYLCLLLLAVVLAQMTIFLVGRYSQLLVGAADTPTRGVLLLHYLVGVCGFVALVGVAVLLAVLLLILAIMLIGRLVGVSQLTGAFIWCLVLAALLFPWQAFLADGGLATAEFRIPGILYTWGELLRDARFGLDQPSQWTVLLLKWARYIGFPLVAVILTLLVHIKSRRGLRQALGEAAASGLPQSQALQ
ncbi:MAG: hypothetical protein IT447_12945 [Phycisphaerales bacterium]|jgi:hypothetical protein|nr:hypothetical protein [Phycisphaerales bacterium]